MPTNPRSEQSRVPTLFRSLFGKTESLGFRSLVGGGLILATEAYSNLLRLGANLILTRLLYPEAFGLMLIVNLAFTAFAMFSDIGIRNAIIVRKDLIDPDFLNTAWTMAIIRGLILFLVGLALAGPIADFYDEELLFGLVLLASLSPLIQGFTSPRPILEEKRVKFGRVVVWQMTSQTIGTLVVVVWVFLVPTVWVLAASMPVGASIGVITSFLMFRGERPRFRWHRPAVAEIFNFGKWIFAATALTFLARQGDALVVSKYSTAEQFGIFGIALTFAKLVELLVERLSWTLLFPVFSELRQGSIDQFNIKLKKIKVGIYSLCLPFILLFSIFGRDLIQALYDPRYHNAGWMLEILAVGSIFFAASGALINIPMSFGDSYRHMWLQVTRFLILLGTLIIGAYFWGFTGLILAIPVAQALYFPALCLLTRKYGITGYGVDLAFAAITLLIVGFAWFMRGISVPF